MNILDRIWETYSDHPLEPGTFGQWAERNPDKLDIYNMIEEIREKLEKAQNASS